MTNAYTNDIGNLWRKFNEQQKKDGLFPAGNGFHRLTEAGDGRRRSRGRLPVASLRAADHSQRRTRPW